MASHPKHPATIHFPITFTMVTGVLDLLYLASITPATSQAVASAFKTLDIQIPLTLLPTLSYYAMILTIITAVPAIITGALEFMPVVQRDGLGSKKAQTGVVHALVNDITVFGAAYTWWSRRNENGFTPSTTNVALSAAVLPISMFAAYLGGSLIFKHGIGVGRGSDSKVKKSQ
ncbi:hypothetical protein K458DRAFT_459498 [Lentithecium fluviatile CBS 122367]|uniref:DUF2231 domain-containing protein n=1 Tax=Lentithecium fluviatile CBS 122367 TaxID=1168545 RepID=A0A6G1JIN9_9PLEO|nr:hypothetical protein K458DRAFT_459498 [Lentithecium fluviatile CBS 122367]